MYDMHFKKSENIARKQLEIGCDPDDVTILDKYLAGRHRKCFTLFDAKSKTGLGNYTEPLLNKFVQEEILREPKARHLCPVHAISLKIINDIEGKCIDCNGTHLLSDCETEDLYERLVTPDTWSNGDPVMTSISAVKEHTQWWKSDTFKIAAFTATVDAIVGILSIAVSVLLHFNPVSPPTPVSNSLPATVKVTPSPNPTITATATIMNSPTPGSVPNVAAEKTQKVQIQNRRYPTRN